MAHFVTTDLGDELVASTTELSAPRSRGPGRGHAQKLRWESPVRESEGINSDHPRSSATPRPLRLSSSSAVCPTLPQLLSALSDPHVPTREGAPPGLFTLRRRHEDEECQSVR